jgi:hypothetical protein
LPSAPAHWISAKFIVDGQAIPGSTTDGDGSVSATWCPGSAANPSEHDVYLTATVTDAEGHRITVDSRESGPPGAGATPFALANVSLQRLEVTDAQFFAFTALDVESHGDEFLVPTTPADPTSRPHWQLIRGARGVQERGPYTIGKAINQRGRLKLTTNATGTPEMPTRIQLDAALTSAEGLSIAVWPEGWHTSVPVNRGEAVVTTPVFPDCVEITTLTLRSSLLVKFRDGVEKGVSSRKLSFEVMTNLQDREPDPAPDPDAEVEAPADHTLHPSLQPFMLAPDAIPGFQRSELGCWRHQGKKGWTYSATQPFRRHDKRGPTWDHNLDVEVCLYPTAGQAERNVLADLNSRSVLIPWEHRTYSGRKLTADQLWCAPRPRDSSSGYALYARAGRFTVYIGLSAGGSWQSKPLDPATIRMIEEIAERLLVRYRAGSGPRPAEPPLETSGISVASRQP